MASGAHLLRSNGDNWVSDHVPEHLFATSIWGSAANNVFAVVRSHPWLESAGRILRWDGASWVVTYNENASPFAVHGVSGTDILATGVDGRVWRWNGTTWNDAASISNAQGRVVNRLFMLSSTLAYAGNNCVAGEPGGAWRWNGTAWASAGIVEAGFGACLHALFGTGPSDVFAVVSTTSGGDRVLIRWNGMSWSLQANANVAGADFGTGIPGLSMILGSNSSVTIGRP